MEVSRAIAWLPIALVLGCGSGPSSAPSSPVVPSPVPPPIPTSHPTLNGYVYDTAYQPVVGATVSIVDGAQAGASTTSDTSGFFFVRGSFGAATTVRVFKDGYAAATGTATGNNSAGGSVWVSLLLDDLAKPADITGDYTLTIAVDSACASFPRDASPRTYQASIAVMPDAHTHPGTALTLTIVGGSFLPDRNSFPVGVAGNRVAFSVYHQEDFGLIEQITPETFLAVQGQATVSVADGPVTQISTPFSGILDYCALQAPTGWTYQCTSGARITYEHCDSTKHQLTLRRK